MYLSLYQRTPTDAPCVLLQEVARLKGDKLELLRQNVAAQREVKRLRERELQLSSDLGLATREVQRLRCGHQLVKHPSTFSLVNLLKQEAANFSWQLHQFKGLTFAEMWTFANFRLDASRLESDRGSRGNTDSDWDTYWRLAYCQLWYCDMIVMYSIFIPILLWTNGKWKTYLWILDFIQNSHCIA